MNKYKTVNFKLKRGVIVVEVCAVGGSMRTCVYTQKYIILTFRKSLT